MTHERQDNPYFELMPIEARHSLLLDRVIAGTRNTLGAFGVGATILTGMATIIGEGDLDAGYRTGMIVLSDSINSCDDLPADALQTARNQLDEGRTRPKSNEYSAYDSDDKERARADRFNVRITYDAAQEAEARINKADTDEAVVAAANEYTLSQFGFKTFVEDVSSDPKSRNTTLADDARDMVSILYKLPQELVQKVAQGALKEVELNADVADENEFGLRVGHYRSGSQTIRVAIGHVNKVFTHEFGHAAAVKESLMHCFLPTVKPQAAFTASNPPGLEYTGDGLKAGRNAISTYAGTGEDEDYAENVFNMATPESLCPLNGSSPVKEKMAVTVATLNDIAPHSGSFLADRMADRQAYYGDICSR